MSSDTDHTSSLPPPGLPPVAPPSGRFIAQLFLIPGLIATVIVLIILVGNYLVAEQHSPESILRNLDSPNEDIRWRAANDLAQVLRRPESVAMASDPDFALELTERLDRALLALRAKEQSTAERTKGMTEADSRREWKLLEAERNHVLFLIAAVGEFTIPVGAPILCDVATNNSTDDLKANTLRRRRAVFALANLGEKIKLYKDLSSEEKEDILAILKEEAGHKRPRSRWAQAAHNYLTRHQPLGVDVALEKCAESEDTFLRELVAFCLAFWDGPRVEPTLLRLSHDDGHGTRIRVTEDD
jgi:hypothetical protein